MRLVLYLAFAIILLVVWYRAAYQSQLVSNATHEIHSTTVFIPDTQTKYSGCIGHAINPDHACTPGAIFSSATKEDVCASGYSKSVRDVPVVEKKAVYEEYGISHRTPGEYEVDHFISLELGGSNTVANLWPEAAAPQPGFHEKDKVENYLHQQVCSGAMTLGEAQRKIAKNWYAVYLIL